MNLKLTYIRNNVTKTITESNDDIEIIFLDKDNRHTITILPHAQVVLLNASLTFKHIYDKKDRILINGIQSWTETKEYSIDESIWDISKVFKPLVDKFSLDMYGDNYFKKYNRHVLHSYGYSRIRGINPLQIGSFNYENAYLIINHKVKENQIVLESDVEGILTNKPIVIFDYLWINNSESKEFFEHFKPLTTEPIIAYTSWYKHYQNIDENKILYSISNLNSTYNLFQIDDGYEQYVGDWDIWDKKFPNGFDKIIKELDEKKVTKGIWLAPFVAETKSKLFQQHPEYFIKKRDGSFLKAGCAWSGYYPLNIYQPGVKEYIIQSLRKFKNMGFDFFKLDFLYAPSLQSLDGKSRAMVASDCLKIIREALGDSKVLACGAIIESLYSKVEYCRIGPDVSLKFDDAWFMKIAHRERISTKQAALNTIFRADYNEHMFMNDPDVFLLREDMNSMSEDQRRSFYTISKLFSHVHFTSDDILEYPAKTKKWKEEIDQKLLNSKVDKVYSDKKNVYIEAKIDNKNYLLKYNIKKGKLLWIEQA